MVHQNKSYQIMAVHLLAKRSGNSLLYMVSNGSYNIAETPWTGGFFERMVRSVKQCLKKILGQSRVRIDELLTMLKEIGNVCNCRPLTYIYDDDIIEPLSPNHLIHGRAIAARCEDIVNMKETDVSVESLNQRYKHVQSLTEQMNI